MFKKILIAALSMLFMVGCVTMQPKDDSTEAVKDDTDKKEEIISNRVLPHSCDWKHFKPK